MDTIGILIARLGLALLVLPQLTPGPRLAALDPHAASDLHAQTAAAVLARRFSSADISYIALDDHGQVVAQRWQNSDRAIPIGSLVKPFVAVTYGRRHNRFPQFRCTGRSTCWLPRGHGTLGVTEAIALSCNSYFRQLAASAGPGLADSVRERFAVTLGSDGTSGRAAPAVLVRAYLELATLKQERAVAPVMDGMAMSAQKGTGKAVGARLQHVSVLAKTGTAPCTHAHKAPGDGFALVMAPADHPRLVLLVRVHGKPGASAADTAGRMLTAIDSDGAGR